LRQVRIAIWTGAQLSVALKFHAQDSLAPAGSAAISSRDARRCGQKLAIQPTLPTSIASQWLAWLERAS
jgi:hypothetical protein